MDNKNEIIINLSQRGGSHCKPLLAMLNRELPDNIVWIAKSGNRCVKASDIRKWAKKQHEIGIWWYYGTNRHNTVQIMGTIIPRNGEYYYTSILNLVRDEQKEMLRQIMAV